jgi:DNA polymerase-4
MHRVLFHLDMDAFYAAVEQRDNPALRGKPVIVGSPPTQRGVVCAASYEARKYGVRSAMPSMTAGRLCPAGIFVPVHMQKYKVESGKIMEIAGETGGIIEQVSIDEAYLDLSSICQSESADQSLYNAVPLGQQLKRRIAQERGLTASVGIAGNKLLAKLASDFSKPNGLTLIPERDKVLFLRPMPVQALYGVGKVTAQLLEREGIRTVGDLQDSQVDLRRLVGSFAMALMRFAFGEDDRPLETGDEVKSISSENTFLKDTDDRKILRHCLREQAQEIAGKLQTGGLAAQTIQVKVRYSDFSTLTRQITMDETINEAAEVYRLACFLLAKEKPHLNLASLFCPSLVSLEPPPLPYHKNDFCSVNNLSPFHRVARHAMTSPIVLYCSPSIARDDHLLNHPVRWTGRSTTSGLVWGPLLVRNSTRRTRFDDETVLAFH